MFSTGIYSYFLWSSSFVVIHCSRVQTLIKSIKINTLKVFKLYTFSSSSIALQPLSLIDCLASQTREKGKSIVMLSEISGFLWLYPRFQQKSLYQDQSHACQVIPPKWISGLIREPVGYACKNLHHHLNAYASVKN